MSLRAIGLIGILFGLLVAALSAEAQQAGKVYRIGYLRGRSGSPTINPRQIAFRQRLRELGYIEGQNLVIEDRSAEDKHERFPDLAAELVRLKVDVIVTPPSPRAIRAAQRATRTIPIVMSGSNRDPVEAGFVVSLARPGGNITGVTTLDSALHGKRLELLKEAFPRISHVAILWSRRQQKRLTKEIKAVGQALGIQIQPLVVTGHSTLDDLVESAFSTISQDSPDALLVPASSFVNANQARIIEFTAKRRLPTIYARSRFVDAGGLMSYSADRQNLSRRTATYVDKIFKGANPATLPIEQPTKFELIINLKTAKQLGLTIPPEVLFQADRLIR
jgi:putative ABC transport system substrate-binding protein